MNDHRKHRLNTGVPLHGAAVFKDADVKTKKAPENVETFLKLEPATAKQMAKIARKMGLDDVDDLPKGYIAGYASTDDLDLHRDVVVPGAFDASIAERGLTGPSGVKLLLDHRSDRVAGVIKRLETRDGKLWIEALLNLEITYVNDAYLAAKDVGGINFSVGFRLQDYEFKENDDGFEYLEIKRGDLFEVSMVAFPANPNAQMTFIKSHDDFGEFQSLSELEKALVADKFQVKSRNAAHALVACVKRLVLPKETPAVTKKTDDYSAQIALAKSINMQSTKE